MKRAVPQIPVTPLSLKTRLALGAVLLAAGTLLTAGILYVGMARVADRLDTALASETRMARYATLSTQAATFLVIAAETIQSGPPPDVRIDRLTPVSDRLRTTFAQLRKDVGQAVAAAETLGLDEQSRYGTQSLGLARMEAMLESTLTGLATDTTDTVRLRAHIDTFATSFDPLLNQAVNTEVLFRNDILAGIDELRLGLTRVAAVIAGLTVLLVSGFYVGLIRPQFRRLDRLRAAAAQIGQEEFAISLPDTSRDEIGQLYAETNRMAAALQARRDEVQAEWGRLNDVIAARTAALTAANARLEQTDETRRRLFADISHELRTPLTVILMEAQLGRKAGAEPDHAFRTIETRATRLNRRIDDLLRVARSDSGQLALDIKQIDLARLAQEVVEEVQAELDSAGLELLPSDIPALPVHADPNWARQTLVSLIRNAIRHARAGGLIQLDPVLGDTHAGLAVTDNGPGIAENDQATLFDRFTQGGSNDAQGFGLGLALAAWVTQEQGGEITLTSPLPRAEALGDAPGTKIAVRLPRVPA